MTRVLSDVEVYRAANQLVQQHGTEVAPIIAAQRADELLEAGDMGGRAVWLRILKAIRWMVESTPPENEPTSVQ